MASKEIGLMQIRTGKQRNLFTLEHGELALTTDEGRFFCGLPSTITPASLVAGRTKSSVPGSGGENIELLTEFTPAHVLNRVLYKPIKSTIPEQVGNAAGTSIVSIPSADRLFVDYVAYSPDGTLETGSIQILAIDGGDVIISQQNNTSDSDGLVKIRALTPDVVGAITNLTIENSHSESMIFEYIYRGWTQPI